MQTKRIATIVTVVVALTLLLAASSTVAGSRGRLTPDNPNPPASTVKLIFIHHSCGSNWLRNNNGGLGIALRDSNYFVSDTNYGWGPDSIGDSIRTSFWSTSGPRWDATSPTGLKVRIVTVSTTRCCTKGWRQSLSRCRAMDAALHEGHVRLGGGDV